MKTFAPTRPRVKPAADLERQFRREGYQPGLPPSVPRDIFFFERRTYGRCQCPGCRRRGLRVEAFTNDDGGYRLLGTCPHCGSGEEF